VETVLGGFSLRTASGRRRALELLPAVVLAGAALLNGFPYKYLSGSYSIAARVIGLLLAAAGFMALRKRGLRKPDGD
jgi:hypothetical protein